MTFGVCNLSIVPLRAEPSDQSELISQILYGELLTVLETQKKWSFIKLESDHYEGWIDNKQFIEISEDDYNKYAAKEGIYVTDLVEHINCNASHLYPVTIGASLKTLSLLGHNFDGHSTSGQHKKTKLIETALIYLNSPYLWGGKTPFGIDCSGFTQMVYKINGYQLPRDAKEQALQGEPLSFIEETEPGDLAFFDNDQGEITHVGIIMQHNHIIHAHGKVRIDILDHSGIYNSESNTHTHKLRIMKKLI